METKGLRFKMKFKKFYEIYSLLVGLCAILTLLYGIFLGLFFNIKFQLHEPIISIAIIEILIGFSVIPYYLKRFLEIRRNKRFK